MSVLCLKICRICVPNVTALGIMFLKNCTSSKFSRLLDTASNALFSASGLKDEKLITKSKPTTDRR